MNLLASLKNKLQVLDLRKQLKSAQAKAKESAPIPAAVTFTGGQCLDSISASGEFTGSNWDALQGMKFALVGIKEAGATPSLNRTEGISDAGKDYWLQVKQGKSLKTCAGPEVRISVMAAYRELAAAVAAKKPAESPAPKPEAKPSAPAPAPSPKSETPKSPVMSTTPISTQPAKPGPLATTSVAELAKTLTSPFKNDAGKAASKIEIGTRSGFFVIESTPFAAHWRYLGMSSEERAEWAASGGRIGVRNPTKAELAGTAAAYSSSIGADEEPTIKPTGSPHDYVFPLASTRGRALEQFLSLSRADIKVICAECSLPRGAALRRELFDATLKKDGGFFRNESERNLLQGFKAAFSQGFNYIAQHGPDKADDEAPPVLSGQMTAEELLALPADAAARLVDQSYRPGGRSIRRELKVAYMKATGAQKVAMMGRYEGALKRHIHEYI